MPLPEEGGTVLEQVALAASLIVGLEERIERTLDLDYPSTSVQIAAEQLMRRLVRCLRSRLQANHDELASDRRKSVEIANDTSLITRSCALLGELVRYFEGAQVEYTAWGLVHQVEAFVVHLTQNLGLNALVLVRPRWKYNWSSYDVLNAFAEAVDAFLATPPLDPRDAQLKESIDSAPNVLVLSFPSSERDNILWYATWGHEIGHFLNLTFRFTFEDEELGDPEAGPRSQSADVEEIDGGRVVEGSPGEVEHGESQDNDAIRPERDDEPITLALQLANRATFDPEAVERLAGLLGQPASAIRETTLRRRLARELEHSLADIWSVHLLGPCALYVAGEVGAAVLERDWRGFEPHDPHPPMWSRVELMLDELEFLGYPAWLDAPAVRVPGVDQDFEQQVRDAAKRKFEELRVRAAAARQALPKGTKAETLEGILVDHAREEACKEAREAIRQAPLESPCNVQLLEGSVFRLSQLLKNATPPTDFMSQNADAGRSSFPLILNAAWLYWLWRMSNWTTASGTTGEYINERRRTNRLVLKAFRSTEAQCWFLARTQHSGEGDATSRLDNVAPIESPLDSGLLGRSEILSRLRSGVDVDSRLVVNPLLDANEQIKGSAIDIRLGNEFIVTHRMRLPVIDPMEGEEKVRQAIRKYQYHVYVNFGDYFVLHPSQFALGATLEFVGMPTDVSAVVVGRSSWGRLGLVIATATKVDPGFRGCITLELLNLGDSAIMIYPGLSIGQLLLYKMSSPQPYKGRYDIPIGPEFSKIYDDRELHVWGPRHQ